ncbi:MAG: tRNA (adenosine(37)-N6)-threonylcarbamoyltransferase complex ATPase subunit type 1 TsaE [Epsilonproteobacteria bacterium]|nr:MAG: tRNA (adenosine(37)-N6)-threonylcarbamoyltransferase complex ATPase subunit type 1 TsaE [Campylobacterota bacterium]
MSQIVFDKVIGLDGIQDVAKKLDGIINKQNQVVLLQGDLASGKTTFVQQYLKLKKIETKATSPTFSLQNIYDDFVYHYDMYNSSFEKFVAMGLFNELEKIGLHFVEWGDEKFESMLKLYGFDSLKIEIKKHQNKRRYIICIN